MVQFEAMFFESQQEIAVDFEQSRQSFELQLGEVFIVESKDIPSQYGLVTYDQNRTITIT